MKKYITPEIELEIFKAFNSIMDLSVVPDEGYDEGEGYDPDAV